MSPATLDPLAGATDGSAHVLAGVLVMTLGVLGLFLLVTWWALPSPRQSVTPPPLDAPGTRFRCWCHSEPAEVLVVPRGSVVRLPSGRHAKPSRRATLRYRLRAATSAEAREGGIRPTPVPA
ncbi:hypothetical protein GCM10009544_14070 [Streptomyces stramineus]|uniref:Uncharacterized protein n=1 Tax=Streptomyces stramineus TaxID=173861 RepID=A0ABN0ZM35_9ACTN